MLDLLGTRIQSIGPSIPFQTGSARFDWDVLKPRGTREPDAHGRRIPARSHELARWLACGLDGTSIDGLERGGGNSDVVFLRRMSNTVPFVPVGNDRGAFRFEFLLHGE